MNTKSNDQDAGSLAQKTKSWNWTKVYSFAILSATCELVIICWNIFHGMQRSPLDAVTGIAKLGAILSGLMSIFIDRSPWPGIVLFWLGLSSLFLIPI